MELIRKTAPATRPRATAGICKRTEYDRQSKRKNLTGWSRRDTLLRTGKNPITIQQGFRMIITYDHVWDYFDANPLPPLSSDIDFSDDDESERLERFAIPLLETMCNAFIHEFDCHDAINTIADTYEVERSVLLEYYDTKY